MRYYAFVLITILAFTPTSRVHAGEWGAEWATTIYEEMRDIVFEIGDAVQNIFTTQSIQLFIASNILSDDGSSFVADYKDYLFNQANADSTTYAQDYLTSLVHGRTTGNYGYGEGEEGILNAYHSRLYQAAARGLYKDAIGQAVNIDKYCNLVEGEVLLFGQETTTTFECFSSVLTNPLNHPTGLGIAAQNAKEWERKRQERIKYAQATSNEGALPQLDAEGLVVRPAIQAQEFIEQSIETGLTNATNIVFEADHPVAKMIVSTVVPALMHATNKAIDREISRMRKKTQRKIQEISDRTFSGRPGAPYQTTTEIPDNPVR